ncbi:MAG: hypothetical protein ACRDRP_05015 [Pseudonocardiaceae bacterium]
MCVGPPVRDPDAAADCRCSCHPKPAGTVDGRGFYLRERHGYYRVTIAPDDDPAADPWELPAERATLDIADGEDDDLTGPDGGYDVAHALGVAVHAVRTFLARRECEHQQCRTLDAGTCG